MPETDLPRAKYIDRRLYTRDLGGAPFYGERIMKKKGVKFRQWNTHRSKLASFIHLGGKVPLKRSSRVLYLGAGSGTTVSHVSDIADQGAIFAIEFAPVPFKKLASVAAARNNIVPLMEDAFRPSSYQRFVPDVDILYQDVSQKDQAGIFSRNAGVYGPKFSLVMLKVRSMDIAMTKEEALESFSRDISPYEIADVKDISRFHKDHLAITIK